MDQSEYPPTPNSSFELLIKLKSSNYGHVEWHPLWYLKVVKKSRSALEKNSVSLVIIH